MKSGMFDYSFEGRIYPHPKNGYGIPREGMDKLAEIGRLQPEGSRLTFILYADESAWTRLTAPWYDTVGADDKQFVVQTNSRVVQRCMQMTTDPGDIVFDPTCGSGTTAYVAERWGRRWVTCDTSRVAVNVTRKRLLSAMFPHFAFAGPGSFRRVSYAGVCRRLASGSLARGLEPGEIVVLDDPQVDGHAIRVTVPSRR